MTFSIIPKFWLFFLLEIALSVIEGATSGVSNRSSGLRNYHNSSHSSAVI